MLHRIVRRVGADYRVVGYADTAEGALQARDQARRDDPRGSYEAFPPALDRAVTRRTFAPNRPVELERRSSGLRYAGRVVSWTRTTVLLDTGRGRVLRIPNADVYRVVSR